MENEFHALLDYLQIHRSSFKNIGKMKRGLSQYHNNSI